MEKYDFSNQQPDYNYGGYDDFSYNSGGSAVSAALKGILGAFIGAIPGTLLWIILGKLGVVAAACGIVVALGIFIGYAKMDPAEETSSGVKLIVCTVVFVIALSIAEMVVWTWKISDVLHEHFETTKTELIDEIISENPDLTYADVTTVLTDELFAKLFKEEYGVGEGTFGECFANFSTLLNKLGLKGKFWLSLGESLVFGLAGGLYLIVRTNKNEI